MEEKKSENILIASLGDSPVVVSAMYDLLTQQEGIEIDKVYVLYPEGQKAKRSVERAYTLVRKALQELADTDRLEPVSFGFEDVDSWLAGCRFLSTLYKLLDDLQKQGHQVYLSLAGGRKSMAALMAWVAPFFSCIEKLYHILDQDDTRFYSEDYMAMEMDDALALRAMHPPLDRLILVDIPFDRDRQMEPELHKKLRQASNSELERLQYEDLDAARLARIITQKDNALRVQLTQHAWEQFAALRATDEERAREIKEQILNNIVCASYLRRMDRRENYAYKHKSKKYLLWKATQTIEIPFKDVKLRVFFTFYTQPEELYVDNLERVVICDLYVGKEEDTRKLKEISSSPDFSINPQHWIEDIPPFPCITQEESILIVPLGKYPMVATQLYTLLTKQKQRTIREVILVIPNNGDLVNSAEIAEEALQREKHVRCRCVRVDSIKDIASKEDCQIYQQTLEDVIDYAQAKHPEYKIDLALSGGRKGMTAMTISAAQKKGFKFVYHTLIKDEQLSERIEEETTIEALNDLRLDRDEIYNRLFLREYIGNEPYYTKFALFKVPVFSADE